MKDKEEEGSELARKGQEKGFPFPPVSHSPSSSVTHQNEIRPI
jgi:hypothetical protein